MTLPEGYLTHYRLDDSDPPFPAVVRCHAEAEGATTFTEAKRQLVECIRHHLRHWQYQMSTARDLRKADVAEPDAEERCPACGRSPALCICQRTDD